MDESFRVQAGQRHVDRVRARAYRTGRALLRGRRISETVA